MSLRLDPKYHGVRVARVRPKFKALSAATLLRSTKGYTRVRYLWFNDSDALMFTRSRIPYTSFRSWVPVDGKAARIDGVYYRTQKEALETLGLR